MPDIDALRYPVGTFQRISGPIDRDARAPHIRTIADMPARLRSMVDGWSDARLDTPYRPGGWTARQVIHHVPDSHVNAYVRMKLAATEDNPTIRTYEEQLWAELADGKHAPIDMSLDLLAALHRRWVAFLTGLTDEGFARTFTHPQLGAMRISEALAMYAWHCRHHLGHIEIVARS